MERRELDVMKFLFMLAEDSMLGAVEQGAAAVQRKHGIKIEIKFWTARMLKEGSTNWNQFEQDLKECDLFLASMISADTQQVYTLERLLKTYGPVRRDRAIIVLNSMPNLMALTRMGDFEFTNFLQFMKNGPVGKISGFVGGIRKLMKHDDGKEVEPDFDPDEVRGRQKLRHHKPAKKGVVSGMMGVLRHLPTVLKLVPGQAQDLRAYLVIMLYWLNSSPENYEEFFKYVIDRYMPSYTGPKLKAKDPAIYPQLALFHPDAPGKYFQTREEYEKWLAKARPQSVGRPRVGLLTMQGSYMSGNYKHIYELIRQLDAEGVESMPCFVGGLDYRPAVETFYLDEDKKGNIKPVIDLLINTVGFSMVGSMAGADPEAGIAELKRLNRPYWSIMPLIYQNEAEWRSSRTGLSPLQTAFMVAVPELDGASEPRVYAATGQLANDKTIQALPAETRRVVGRAARYVKLRNKPNRDKKISVVLFCYPPNKGAIGTAAYLGVFESLYRIMKRLKSEGYNVEVPQDSDDLRKQLTDGNSAVYGTTANVHTHMPVTEYMKLFPDYVELEQYWGSPPGHMLNDSEGFQILGKQFGNLLVAIQPTFGYEDDPLRLLMAENVGTNHAFAAFYTWLNKVYKADAALHFGTHGALEFMPGKQVGLTAKCWPDRLIGDIPNFYLYCVNNPSEGTIAKRRSYATLISYLSPPMENAGLYRQLSQLKDVINQYRNKLNEGGDGALLESIIEQAQALELKVKVTPEQGIETYLLELYAALLEIEERLIPTGLHLLDELPDEAFLHDVLNSVGSFSRGKPGSNEEIPALTELVAEGFGYNLDDVRKNATRDSETMGKWENIERSQRESVRIFVENWQKGNKEAARNDAVQYLRTVAKVDPKRSTPMMEYLSEVAEGMYIQNEINQIVRAFNAEYIEPSPGSNIVQNPAVLPTGRNIHAVDPALIPSPLARRNAERSVKAIVEKARQEMELPEGQYPETIAMVLWGTDNIKTDGEGIAQCLAMVGARAISDGLGKMTDVKLLPLSDLNRPRLDVVVTVSGIFRDLLPLHMGLIDRAVRLAAQADESEEQNFIKKHVRVEMEKGATFDEAVTRVFSNAPGQYGASVNSMIDNSVWQDDNELSDAFLSRKSFAYGIKADGEGARKLMESALSKVDLSFQNVDSAEVGITDVDHYYEYLGGISKSVEKLTGRRATTLVADSLSASSSSLSQGNSIKTLQEAVRLESRTKLLNPKWYESMLKYGFEGVREIEVRVSNTYGWSATNDAVDKWVYDGVNETFVQDEEMRDRLAELNPHSLKGIVGRLLEANGRGFWEADASMIEKLKEIFAGLEDEIEGVGEPNLIARK
ncbi:magnesium chelatase subunit H [Candidatus Chlorohelix allophototropha]